MNETLGWTCVLAGLVAGVLLGLRFHEEGWLGGYASFPRRMLRLGHVALVALGLLNVLAARSLAGGNLGDGARATASVALGVGAVAMPLACALVAWRPRLRPLFALPVVALLLGVSLLLGGSLP
jgi:hypothetical protein